MTLALAVCMMAVAPTVLAEDVAVFVKGGITQTVHDADLVNYGVGAAFALPNNLSLPVEFLKTNRSELALAGIGFKVGTVKNNQIFATAQLGDMHVAGVNLVAEAFTVTVHHKVGAYTMGPSIRYCSVRGHSGLSEDFSITRNFSFGKH